jgi:hypothetical protein
MSPVGEHLNSEDLFWQKVADEMTPGKSLERLDSHGKYLFSTASIVGTLLTGFGIFGATVATIPHSPWLLIPLALACLSLALAMMGITPRSERVIRNDLFSVKDHYNSLIRRRGRFVFWAGVCFALSLLSVAFVLILSYRSSAAAATISTRLTGSENNAKLTGKVEFDGLPRAAIAETEILGFVKEKKNIEVKPVRLFNDISHADSAGKLTISVELEQLCAYERFQIQAKIKSGYRTIREEKVELRR